MQCRGLGNPYGIVFHGQARRPFERERAAAGTRRHDNCLSGTQLARQGSAERFGAVRRAHYVDQFRALECRVDVVPGVRDVPESRDIALGVDAALLRDLRHVVGEVGKIE